MRPIIEVEDLVKIFVGGNRAVDEVSFDVQEGEIFGFLGPNGAGKTTTINVITTLVRPTSGVVRVAGHDVSRHPDAVRRLVGYAQQAISGVVSLDVGFTVRGNINLMAELQDVDRLHRPQFVEDAADALGLKAHLDRKVEALSGGWARRVEIAMALVHRPAVLFLDEPTTGLDPEARRLLWDYLVWIKDTGMTIFLTTQYLEEAERLADRVAIIKEGRIVAAGNIDELKAEVGTVEALKIRRIEEAGALPTLEDVYLRTVNGGRP